MSRCVYFFAYQKRIALLGLSIFDPSRHSCVSAGCMITAQDTVAHASLGLRHS